MKSFNAYSPVSLKSFRGGASSADRPPQQRAKAEKEFVPVSYFYSNNAFLQRTFHSILFWNSFADGQLVIKSCPATFTSQIYRSSQLRCSSLSSDQMKYIIQKEKCEEFTRDLLRLFGVVCFVSLVFIFRNTELMFKGLAGSCKEWKSIEDLENVFKSRKTSMSGKCWFTLARDISKDIFILF